MIKLIQVCESKEIVSTDVDQSKTLKSRKLEFVQVIEHQMDAQIAGIKWISPQALFIYLHDHMMRILDPFTGQEMKVVKNHQFAAIPSSIFRTTDLSSSEQPIPTYYNSIVEFGRKVYALTPKSVLKMSILGWSPRIEALVKAGKWRAGIDLALDLFHDRGSAIAGLPRDAVAARKIITNIIKSLLGQYCKLSLARNPSNAEVTSICKFAIQCCISIERLDVLWLHILPICGAYRKNLLILLEPYILHNKISALPSSIMQQLIQLYVSANMLTRIEQIILRLDLKRLDTHEVPQLPSQLEKCECNPLKLIGANCMPETCSNDGAHVLVG